MLVSRRLSARFLPGLVPFLFLVPCLLLVPAGPAHSKTFTVTTTVDADCSDNQCDLPSALAEARSNGEDDTLNITAGTYAAAAATLFSYTFNAAETFALTIVGAGSESTILDGGGIVQVLYIQSPGSVTIRDLTIQNGNATLERGGGLLVGCNGTATISSVVFQENYAQTGGGGAYVSASLGGAIRNSDFTGNLTDDQGGGVWVNVSNGDMTLYNNLFQNNQADFHGGGAYVGANSGNITVTDNDFLTNEVLADGYSGGGLWLTLNSGDGNVSRNRFEGNSAAAGASSGAAYGGGAYLQPSSTGNMLLDGNVFTGNATGGGGRGGGVYVFSSYGTLSLFTALNNVFVDNETQDGGSAMYYETYENTLNFVNNTATLNTGSVAVSIRLDDSIATANVYNNILRGNTGADLSVFDGSTLKEARVNLYNNDVVNYAVVPAIGTTNKAGGGNITADPLLVDAANGDIHLGSGSPAIDAGLNSAPGITAGSVDFEGEDRIQGVAVDMGADESSGGSVPAGPTIVVTDSMGVPDDGIMGFGEVETGPPFKALEIYVQNTGADGLEIISISVTGEEFELGADNENTCNDGTNAFPDYVTLNSNETCKFDVVFDPQNIGSASGEVTIESNDQDNQTVIVNLTGTGVEGTGGSGGGGGCDCSLSPVDGGTGPTVLIFVSLFVLGLLGWRRYRSC